MTSFRDERGNVALSGRFGRSSWREQKGFERRLFIVNLIVSRSLFHV